MINGARKPEVSIVVATYNGQRYLSEQLDSIFAQTYRCREVIASDDASTDGTCRLLEGYRQSAGLVVLAHDRNVGSTGNFERGIMYASGDLIAFADQDDVWQPDKIERSVARLREAQADLVFGDAVMVDESLHPLGDTMWQRIGFSASRRARFASEGPFPILLRENVVMGTTLLARTDLVRRFCPMSPRWVHDAWIAILAAFVSARIALVDGPLLLYRRHARQQIGARKLQRPLQHPGQWFAAQAQAWSDLASFVRQRAGRDGFPLHPDRIAQIESKARHLAVRRDYPDARLQRLAPILRELATGRYIKFAEGVGSALKDLLVHHRSGVS